MGRYYLTPVTKVNITATRRNTRCMVLGHRISGIFAQNAELESNHKETPTWYSLKMIRAERTQAEKWFQIKGVKEGWQLSAA